MAFWQSISKLLYTKAKPIAIVWTLLIFLACFIPSPEKEIPVPLNDKVAHFVLFAGFTFLWLLALKAKKLSTYIIVFLLGCIFGWLVEELQGYLVLLGRSRDVMDIVADTIGAALGLPLYALWVRFFTQKNS